MYEVVRWSNSNENSRKFIFTITVR